MEVNARSLMEATLFEIACRVVHCVTTREAAMNSIPTTYGVTRRRWGDLSVTEQYEIARSVQSALEGTATDDLLSTVVLAVFDREKTDV